MTELIKISQNNFKMVFCSLIIGKSLYRPNSLRAKKQLVKNFTLADMGLAQPASEPK